MEQPEAAASGGAGDKTLAVLAAAVGGARFAEVVRETGLPKATVHRIVESLRRSGHLTQSESAAFAPGPASLELARRAMTGLDIAALARPVIDRLVERADATVHLGVRLGDRIVYLVRADAPGKPYQMPSRVGEAIPLHTSAIGKAVLASLEADELERFCRRTALLPRTKASLRDRQALTEDLDRTRQRGYALDSEENVDGIICVGAAIHGADGRAVHGLSVSSITAERDIEQLAELAPDVVAAATEISALLGRGA
ncbi:MAG: IclR family transcriptional regulator [Bifidobacteriaceae bacterium]|nr:IclR family transcriptional regulator [Bifidobacteriaceae bacterium]